MLKLGLLLVFLYIHLMEDIKKFLTSFLNAMNNTVVGHSLKKWLAVGIFWIILIITIKYTNTTNLEGVLIILASLLLTLMGLNVADKKIKQPKVTPDPSVKEDPNNPVI